MEYITAEGKGNYYSFNTSFFRCKNGRVGQNVVECQKM
jgi:hypothetical protein